MNGRKAIAASRVLAAHIKSSTESSGIHLASSSGRLCQPVDEDNSPMCERIREAIVADKSLSLYAQNIEICSGPSGVTLHGSVKSHEERKRKGIDVAAVVKTGKIFNRLVVRPSQNLSRHSPRISKNPTRTQTSKMNVVAFDVYGAYGRDPGCRKLQHRAARRVNIRSSLPKSVSKSAIR